MSFIAFILYGADKAKAKKEASRIKERSLLAIVCFGGAIGGELGRRIFHHKTHKIYFSLTIYVSLILQIAVGVFILLLGFSQIF
jgi:uncharacterized membrane protein YsdA (DUF1294 family)